MKETLTEKQKEAGNYAKERVRWGGFEIAIETPKGGVRSGKDKGGKVWEVTMPVDYGYLKRTLGVDGDHVDVFLGPQRDTKKAGTVWVLEQKDKRTGKFDEHKLLAGFASKAAGLAAYLKSFSDGARGRVGKVTAVPVAELKAWLKAEGLARRSLDRIDRISGGLTGFLLGEVEDRGGFMSLRDLNGKEKMTVGERVRGGLVGATAGTALLGTLAGSKGSIKVPNALLKKLKMKPGRLKGGKGKVNFNPARAGAAAGLVIGASRPPKGKAQEVADAAAGYGYMHPSFSELVVGAVRELMSAQEEQKVRRKAGLAGDVAKAAYYGTGAVATGLLARKGMKAINAAALRQRAVARAGMKGVKAVQPGVQKVVDNAVKVSKNAVPMSELYGDIGRAYVKPKRRIQRIVAEFKRGFKKGERTAMKPEAVAARKAKAQAQAKRQAAVNKMPRFFGIEEALVRCVRELGQQDQYRYESSYRTKSGNVKHGRRHGRFADPLESFVKDLPVTAGGRPSQIGNRQVVGALLRDADKKRVTVQRGAYLARDVADSLRGIDRRDSSGRKKKKEWDKQWVKNAAWKAGTAVAGGAVLLGRRYARKNPKSPFGKKVMDVERKVRRGVRKGVQVTDEVMKQGMGKLGLSEAVVNCVRELARIPVTPMHFVAPPTEKLSGVATKLLKKGSLKVSDKKTVEQINEQGMRILKKAGKVTGKRAGSGMNVGSGGMAIHDFAKRLSREQRRKQGTYLAGNAARNYGKKMVMPGMNSKDAGLSEAVVNCVRELNESKESRRSKLRDSLLLGSGGAAAGAAVGAAAGVSKGDVARGGRKVVRGVKKWMNPTEDFGPNAKGRMSWAEKQGLRVKEELDAAAGDSWKSNAGKKKHEGAFRSGKLSPEELRARAAVQKQFQKTKARRKGMAIGALVGGGAAAALALKKKPVAVKSESQEEKWGKKGAKAGTIVGSTAGVTASILKMGPQYVIPGAVLGSIVGRKIGQGVGEAAGSRVKASAKEIAARRAADTKKKKSLSEVLVRCVRELAPPLYAGFDPYYSAPGWDLRDARGKSARVFAPHSRKRERREKKWHERVDNIKKMAMAGAGLAAVAGGAAGFAIGRGKKKVPVKRPQRARPKSNVVRGVKFGG